MAPATDPTTTTNTAVWLDRRGAILPWAAVAAVFALAAALGAVVNLDAAAVPKPAFGALTLPGYPDRVSMKEAAAVTEAGLWWLCLTVLLWVVSVGALGLCGWLLHRAFAHDTVARGRMLGAFGVAGAGAVLLAFAAFGAKPFVPFMPLVATLGLIGPGFVTMAGLNAALAFVIGAVVLLSTSMLLWPTAHEGRPSEQMRSITNLMYAAAIFLAVWVATATALYRLCASLLVADARDAAMGLAPTISLMGGLFLSLVLAAAYLAAAAWLQAQHTRLRCEGRIGDARSDEAPHIFLKLHWPKVAGILLPLLPGAASAVLQALMHTPS